MSPWFLLCCFARFLFNFFITGACIWVLLTGWEFNRFNSSLFLISLYIVYFESYFVRHRNLIFKNWNSYKSELNFTLHIQIYLFFTFWMPESFNVIIPTFIKNFRIQSNLWELTTRPQKLKRLFCSKKKHSLHQTKSNSKI